jgi:hypothetical protein
VAALNRVLRNLSVSVAKTPHPNPYPYDVLETSSLTTISLQIPYKGARDMLLVLRHDLCTCVETQGKPRGSQKEKLA